MNKTSSIYGDSPQRIAFLKKIIEEAPGNGLTPYTDYRQSRKKRNAVKINNDYFLYYFNEREPIEQEIVLPDDGKFQIEIIGTWEMTISKLDDFYSGRTLVKLPGKPYIALRIIKSKE